MVVMTDGAPTDPQHTVNDALGRVAKAERRKRTESIGQTPLPDPTGPSGWMKV